jgi:hypothetical protein
MNELHHRRSCVGCIGVAIILLIFFYLLVWAVGY